MSTAFIARRRHLGGRQNAIAVPEPGINDEVVSGMEYNETGKWREGFDLAGWAKEIREVRRKERFFCFFVVVVVVVAPDWIMIQIKR